MRFGSMRGIGKKRSLQSGVECLEGRICPSVTVFAIPMSQGNELAILGDSLTDRVNITDQGNGSVAVRDSSGTLLGAADHVKLLYFNGEGGRDIVNYTLTNQLTNSESIFFQLGNGGGDWTHGGGNFATIDLSKGAKGANLSLSVKGGVGNNDIQIKLGPLSTAHIGVLVTGGAGDDIIYVGDPLADIAADSSLAVQLASGAGDDDIFTAFTGEIFGTLSASVFGGPGNDSVGINLKAEEGSTGNVILVASGDTSQDKIKLYANDYAGDEGKAPWRFSTPSSSPRVRSPKSQGARPT